MQRYHSQKLWHSTVPLTIMTEFQRFRYKLARDNPLPERDYLEAVSSSTSADLDCIS